jgi:hypothetical protein
MAGLVPTTSIIETPCSRDINSAPGRGTRGCRAKPDSHPLFRALISLNLERSTPESERRIEREKRIESAKRAL